MTAVKVNLVVKWLIDVVDSEHWFLIIQPVNQTSQPVLKT
jgi:hypothetical protein